MRVYLAATNSGMSKETRQITLSKSKPRYVLETFFNGENKCLDSMNLVGNDNFLLDSGAFSYMNGVRITLEDMEKYIDRYIEFIKKYKIKYFFEMDVDSVFGLQQVEIWRKKIETSVGYQCIPVWHKGRGIEYWKSMCEQYTYVSIGGFAINDIKIQEYSLIKKLIDYAYYKNVKVHGLGFTKTKILKEYKFYSVDSSSWLTGAVRGQQIYDYKNGCLKSRQLETLGKKVKLQELAAHNMIEWIKFQKHMDGAKTI